MRKFGSIFKFNALIVACTLALPMAYVPRLAVGAALEEVVVTARKREETLQDVPVTVSALGQEQMERVGISALTDVGRLVPNMQISSAGSGGGSSIRLRGIGTSTISAAFDPAVALNIDGVVLAASRLIQSGQFDMRQIEVLKGPQSLYFGKSATAGVISILTNDPTDDFEAMVRGEYGFEEHTRRLEGVISGPVTDTLKARLALVGLESDQIWENLRPGVANPERGEKRLDGRLTLIWDASDTVTAKYKLLLSKHEDDGPNSPMNLICPDGVGQRTQLGGVPSGTNFYNCRVDGKTGTPDVNPALLAAPDSPFADGWNNGVPFSEQDALLTSLQLDWDVSETLALTSITAYLDLETNSVGAFDYGSLGAFASTAVNTYESLSQEFRLESDLGGAFNFSTGIYYADIEQERAVGQAFNAGLTVGPDPITGNGFGVQRNQPFDTKTWSAFLALYYDIADNLQLTAGMRYTRDEKQALISIPYRHSAFVGFLPSGTVITDGLEFEDDNWNPEVALNWFVNDDISLFAAWKTGYKAGGIDASALPLLSLPDNPAIYESETSKGWEVGLKAMLLDSSMRANVTVYSYIFEDLQTQQLRLVPEIQFETFNAGEMTTEGVEADMLWSTPVEGLELRAGFAYTDARFSDTFINANRTAANPNGEDLDGETPFGSADLVASLGFSFDGQLSDNWLWSVSADTRYNDGYKIQDVLNAFEQDSFWITDASIRAWSSDDTWEIALLGRNIGNEYYIIDGRQRPGACIMESMGTCGLPTNPALQGDNFVITAKGREYTLRVTYRF